MAGFTQTINCQALDFGPLAPEQMAEIDKILGRSSRGGQA